MESLGLFVTALVFVWCLPGLSIADQSHDVERDTTNYILSKVYPSDPTLASILLTALFSPSPSATRLARQPLTDAAQHHVTRGFAVSGNLPLAHIDNSSDDDDDDNDDNDDVVDEDGDVPNSEDEEFPYLHTADDVSKGQADFIQLNDGDLKADNGWHYVTSVSGEPFAEDGEPVELDYPTGSTQLRRLKELDYSTSVTQLRRLKELKDQRSRAWNHRRATIGKPFISSPSSSLSSSSSSSALSPSVLYPLLEKAGGKKRSSKRSLGRCIHNCIKGNGNMNFIQCKSMCH